MDLVRLCRAGTLLALAAACTVDRSPLEKRLFWCTSDDECGEGWVCYRALEQLLLAQSEGTGAAGYCAPACGPSAPCRNPDAYCTAQGACVPTCTPGDPLGGCESPKGTSCLRVQLGGLEGPLAHEVEGICVPVATCSSSSACDPVNDTCMTDGFLAERPFGAATGRLDANDLTCIQGGCGDGGQCERGWSCLSELGDDEGMAELDFCLPNCAPDRACPASTACLAYAGLRTCGPGWYLGPGCRDDTNCLVGQCTRLDPIGHDVCSADCADDAECLAAAGHSHCADLGSARGHCWIHPLAEPCTPGEPGAGCYADGLECGTATFNGGLFGEHTFSTCTRECDDDSDCTEWDGFCARGGMFAGDVCLPRGHLGQLCELEESERECVSWFDCLETSEVGVGSWHFCSRSCSDDVDCERYEGFCANVTSMYGGNVCRPPVDFANQCIPERGGAMCSHEDVELECRPVVARLASYDICTLECSVDSQCGGLDAFCTAGIPGYQGDSCYPRLEFGRWCLDSRGEAMCSDGLDCGRVTSSSYKGEVAVDLCTLTCSVDGECADLGAFCANVGQLYAGDVCLPQVGIGDPCTPERASAICAQQGGETIGCHTLHVTTAEGEATADVCTIPCDSDSDCAELDAFCAREESLYWGDVCYPRLELGSRCIVARGEAMCVEELGCSVVQVGVATYPICTHACTTDDECNDVDGFCMAGVPGYGRDFCYPRLDLGASCYAEREDAMCVRSLGCEQVSVGGTLRSVCTRACATDDDCADVGGFCTAGTAGYEGSYCTTRVDQGASCVRPEMCASGSCVDDVCTAI